MASKVTDIDSKFNDFPVGNALKLENKPNDNVITTRNNKINTDIVFGATIGASID